MMITMKNRRNIMLAGCVFILSFCATAQTFSETEDQEDDTSKVTQLSGSEIFRSLGIGTNTNTARSASLQGNQVLLRQIGDFNQLEQ